MQKFKLVGLVVICVSLGLFGGLCIANNKSNETYEDISIKENQELLSMMLETEAGSGKYQETTASSWPTDGYTFNETLSKCENGGTLSWDSTNKKVVMEGNSSDKCYVYFDVAKELFSTHIINTFDIDAFEDASIPDYADFEYEGLVNNEVLKLSNIASYFSRKDDSYWYMGENPSNYVCFGSDASKCPSDSLYRIIEVNTDDTKDSTTRVKLVKYESATPLLLGKDGSFSDLLLYKWDNTNSGDWTKSELNLINLNTNFLNNIGEKWSNMIESYKYWNFDITSSVFDLFAEYDVYLNFLYGSSAFDAYNFNVSNVKYFESKIGLPYLYEFLFATPFNTTLLQEQGLTILYKSNLPNSWMKSNIWLLGSDTTKSSVYSIGVNKSGLPVLADVTKTTFTKYVTPTFYLKADVTYISGDGTINNPYRIELN